MHARICDRRESQIALFVLFAPLLFPGAKVIGVPEVFEAAGLYQVGLGLIIIPLGFTREFSGNCNLRVSLGNVLL